MPNPNVFVMLPSDGTPIDVSALGRIRTVTVETISGVPLNSIVQIEFSNEGANGPWALLESFQQTGKKKFEIAARFMRATRAGGGSAPATIKVASNTDGGRFIDLPATATDGVGAAVDVSLFGTFNTVCCLEPFSGIVFIEISEDNVTWSECMTFQGPGHQSKEFIAQFMRVKRSGATIAGGLPNVDVGAINDCITETGDVDTDEKVKVDGSDALAEFLDDKLQVSGNIAKKTVDKGGGILATLLTVGMGDGAVIMREDYLAPAVQTSSGTYIDSLLSVLVPVGGDYWAIFEGENINQSASSSIEIAVAINGPAPAGVVLTSEREFDGPTADKGWIGTTVPLGTLTMGDTVLVYLRKSSGGGPQTVSLIRRRLTIFKIQ